MVERHILPIETEPAQRDAESARIAAARTEIGWRRAA
jgi:hypothetical protein